MFKEAVIYYPTNPQALAQLHKDLVDFRRATVVRYVKSLNLNKHHIEALYASLREDKTLTSPQG